MKSSSRLHMMSAILVKLSIVNLLVVSVFRMASKKTPSVAISTHAAVSMFKDTLKCLRVDNVVQFQLVAVVNKNRLDKAPQVKEFLRGNVVLSKVLVELEDVEEILVEMLASARLNNNKPNMEIIKKFMLIFLIACL